jgi:hypothetical protein
MFWLGLVIAFFGGGLSIGLSRKSLKQRYPAVRDYHLDILALAVLVIGLAISAVEHIHSERLLHTLTDKSNYFEVSRLNPTGLPFREGKGIRYDTPLSTALRDLYVITDSTIAFKLGEQFEPRYRTVIKQFPRFPFAYVALAESLQHRGDPAWREFARKGISILEKTTAIEGHDPSHDDALATMRSYMSGNFPAL